MRIAHLSDIHFGTADHDVVEAMVEAVHASKPDVVVASGDFTMAGRRSEFRDAATLIARLPQPVLATPGNHDLPVYNILERFVRPFARYRRYLAPQTLDRFRNADVALLTLNSARRWDLSLNWSHGRLSDEQVERADRFFASAQDVRFRALIVHHPFYVPEELPGFKKIGNAEAMLRVLAARRVHAVLSGHLHQQSVTSRSLTVAEDERTVHLLQVASAASTRRRNQPNAFNVLDIDRDGVWLTEHIGDDDRFTSMEPRLVIPLQAPTPGQPGRARERPIEEITGSEL